MIGAQLRRGGLAGLAGGRACPIAWLALASLAWGVPAAGQTPPASVGASPPVPVAPATIARDDEGRATIRAIRLAAPLKLDGVLDEDVYLRNQPFSDYTQMEPRPGEPATEKTEGWIAFDKDNVYISLRCWESQPERMIVNEMRRDSNNIRQGDAVGWGLDTFFDKRNAVLFEVNALGGRTDGQSTNERQYNADWNPVWAVVSGRFEGGWTVEAAIPFKSLRYRPGREQTWGFQNRRSNKWKNEISYLMRVPPALGMGRGDFSASLYATVVGIEAPEGGANLEIKPYVITDLNTDRVTQPARVNDAGADAGLDVKYGITQNLTADFTVNTDFAQVEADEQQVNLTRFSLFFPEKREFFLENLGTFTFGGVFARTGGAGGDSGDTPILFYSRRIGLSQGREVPILAGGRMTGRVGRFSLGLLDIQTKKDGGTDSTNFSVLRLKRDILRRSSVGAMFTGRSVGQSGAGANLVGGVDGTFNFFQNLSVNTYWARSQTDGLARRDDVSYRVFLDYAGDRYGVQLDRLRVGDNFSPEVGFLRRDDMRKSAALLRFSPRQARFPSIRKFSWIAQTTYIEDGPGRLVSRANDGEFAIELQNTDRFSVGVNDAYEFLAQPFAITPAVRIPVGGYGFTTGRVGYAFGQQRVASGTVLLERGAFYDGHRTTLGITRGRANLTPRLSTEPTLSLNRVELPAGRFTTTVAATRVTYTVTPLMFVSALLQYNTGTNAVSGNVRLRWEYRPGSELFVVYNEERDTLTPTFPGLRNRALILKVNRLFRP